MAPRFIASLLWGAAAAAGGAFCGLEAPYCWGNMKSLASSSSTLLSGLTTKAAGEEGGKVAFGDVDGDGVDELVLVSGSSMAVYARDGDAFVARGTVGSSSAFLNPTLADMDGDGDLDLVVGYSSYAALGYFRNDGTGTFEEVPSSDAAYPFNGALSNGDYSYMSPSFADLDLDGDLDCVLGEKFFNLYRFENVDGAWTLTEEIVTAAHYGSPSLGDLDGDGDFDLLIGFGYQDGSWYGRLGYRENIGSATIPLFEEPSDDPLAGFDGSEHSSPVFYDFDDDNATDVVVSYSTGALALLESGSLSDTTSSFYYVSTTYEDPFNAIDVGIKATPALADLDGDGDLDLAIGEQRDNSIVLFNYFENIGTATVPVFERAANNIVGVIDAGTWGDFTPTFGDVDGDNDYDLLSGDMYHRLYYFQNNGDPTAPSFAKIDSGHAFDGLFSYDTGNTLAPYLVDFDGDGDLDLVAAESDTGALAYAENVGTPTSPNYVMRTGDANPFSAVSFSTNSYAYNPACADVDNDGLIDVVVGDRDTDELLWFRNEAGTISGTGQALDIDEPGPALEGYAPTFADVDGDGDLDLVAGVSDGTLRLYVRDYCVPTSPCNSNGICNTARVSVGATMTSVSFSEASCECLVGFEGTYCERCQSGFFGTSCDLCPEGGDEDRKSPRLTDTCGVKNSGVSRGTCDDGTWGGGTCECLEPFSGDGCLDGSCPNGTRVATTPSDGYNFATCEACASGFWSLGPDAATCTKAEAGTRALPDGSGVEVCAPGTYAAAGAVNCSACDDGYWSDAGATTCVGTYAGTAVFPNRSGFYTCPAGTYSDNRAAACTPFPSPTPAPVASASTPAPAPTPRPTTAPVASSSTSSDATSSDDCLPSTLYLTFSGYSSWNGDYDYVAAGSDFTDASEYDICDDSYHLWSKASGTGVLCWSASSQFSNQWIYLYFNGYGASMYGGYQCSDYTADPTDCDMISSTYGLSSASASGCASSEAVVASPTTSDATSSDASSSDDCLPSTLYLTFSGYSSWNGDYDYVAAGSDFTDASEYDICDDSYRASGTGVLCWSASSQFSNQWIYLYFNGYGASMYGGYQCSDYTADPTDCDMISSTYGLSSASASGCASSEAVVASPTTSDATSSDATSSDDCLPSTLYLTFSGYSQWNGDYDYVAAGSDFTDASEYDICDDSYHLWSKASGTGVLCWSASSQFSNQWIYLYFNGYGASMYGGYQCSDYTADPTDCDMISSTYGLSSASASGYDCRRRLAVEYVTGAEGSSAARACEAGTFSPGGSHGCQPCTPGSYQPEEGQEECLVCEDPYTTLDYGATEQDACVEGWYLKDGACAACADVDGADCVSSGTTLERLPLDKDWWRMSMNTSHTYECVYKNACVGWSPEVNGTVAGPFSAGDVCNEGHEGPRCQVCENEYRHVADGGRPRVGAYSARSARHRGQRRAG
ncbi:hypothetical protein AURANDRAFT_64259 [Aureococcus anophagefferens]|uniref:EGF-like domain-containing protein n=1 Tax=Aureococcus anophagefferens TaxID=44056 RepID=F0Y9J2_AURAN|nr:hypothetical protein AURANDRAFT_64259 [Aureococcus anophagefferens]EGB08247.1 hypothetical protein AURANDRAFT_64259 [Aureococcus anophagefferens]|eukprot:XP_009036978.1 hypothetical protein AURANDRAFT_64259 [Aureococcus anophagefferens]